MKTRALLILVLAAASPLAIVHCSSDDSSQTDGGPQNGKDSGSDVTTQNDTGTGTDTGTDAPNACSTGITFDNTKVPGWPNAIPQP